MFKKGELDKILPYDVLYTLYHTQGKSSIEISKELGIAKSTIILKLKQHKIPRRSNSRIGRCNRGDRKLSLSPGDKFSRITLVQYIRTKAAWKCLCDCGKTSYHRTGHLMQGRIKSCGCSKLGLGKLSPQWKGCGDISASIFSSYRHGAKRRDIPFEVTIQELWDILVQQNHMCAITKVPIKLSQDKNQNTASPDRIDPNKGYTKDNIQWLHKTVNQMKWDLPQDEFVQLCKLVAKNT